MKTLVIAAMLIVPTGSAPQMVFDGAVFTEGPAAAPDGTIYFSDITGSARSREAGHIMRYDPRSNRTDVFRSPSGMANGLVFDLDGRLLAAEGADHGGRRVTRTDMRTGKAERLATSYDGKPFNSPNDIAIDGRGRVYFTDPRYVGHEPVEQPLQAVYRIDVDGSVHRIIADAGKPNGIAVSPDGKTLYIAATPHTDNRNTILAYDLGDDGAARFRKVLVAFEKGYADGLTVDRAGNIYCGCGSLGVRVFAPSGEEIGTIAVPAAATNVEFGRGEGQSWLYITAGKAMYRIRLNAAGYHPADVKR